MVKQMANRKDIMLGLECCATGDKCSSDCPYDDKYPTIYKCTKALAKDTLELIKEEPKIYEGMVLSWLSELALNNVGYDEEMTFVEAIEAICERVEIGLCSFFEDKLSERS